MDVFQNLARSDPAEVVCQNGVVETEIAIPQDLSRMPELNILEVLDSKEPFRFCSSFNFDLDTFDFVLLGPEGFNYNMAICLLKKKSIEGQAELWSFEIEGSTRSNVVLEEIETLRIERRVCFEDDSGGSGETVCKIGLKILFKQSLRIVPFSATIRRTQKTIPKPEESNFASGVFDSLMSWILPEKDPYESNGESERKVNDFKQRERLSSTEIHEKEDPSSNLENLENSSESDIPSEVGGQEETSSDLKSSGSDLRKTSAYETENSRTIDSEEIMRSEPRWEDILNQDDSPLSEDYQSGESGTYSDNLPSSTIQTDEDESPSLDSPDQNSMPESTTQTTETEEAVSSEVSSYVEHTGSSNLSKVESVQSYSSGREDTQFDEKNQDDEQLDETEMSEDSRQSLVTEPLEETELSEAETEPLEETEQSAETDQLEEIEQSEKTEQSAEQEPEDGKIVWLSYRSSDYKSSDEGRSSEENFEYPEASDNKSSARNESSEEIMRSGSGLEDLPNEDGSPVSEGYQSERAGTISDDSLPSTIIAGEFESPSFDKSSTGTSESVPKNGKLSSTEPEVRKDIEGGSEVFGVINRTKKRLTLLSENCIESLECYEEKWVLKSKKEDHDKKSQN